MNRSSKLVEDKRFFITNLGYKTTITVQLGPIIYHILTEIINTKSNQQLCITLSDNQTINTSNVMYSDFINIYDYPR